MSKTPFSSKVEILGMLYFFYKEQAETHESWSEFFDWADIGLPMAYMAWQDFVAIKPDSKHYIEDTWNEFCSMIDVDPDAKYLDLKAVFDASPNDYVDEDEG